MKPQGPELSYILIYPQFKNECANFLTSGNFILLKNKQKAGCKRCRGQASLTAVKQPGVLSPVCEGAWWQRQDI